MNRSTPGNIFTGAQGGRNYVVNFVPNLNNVGGQNVVGGVYVSQLGGITPTYGFQVIGYNTSPLDMPATGTATFNGNVSFVAQVGNSSSFGTGTGMSSVDFSNSTVSTTLDLSGGATNSVIPLPDFVVTQTNSEIVGNAFGGASTFQMSGTGTGTTQINSSNLNGQFFGVNAQAVGGQFEIQGTQGGNSLSVNGSFILVE